MNRENRPLPHHDPHVLEVSLALEYGSPTPLSTHWMPLDELVACWLEAHSLLYPTPLAPLLSAVGHALFALSDETLALRRWGEADSHSPQGLPALVMHLCCQQVVPCLEGAARHWGRAALVLESVPPRALDEAALPRVQQLCRIAHTQQARLRALIKEVESENARWQSGQDQQEASA